jgi:hypothetical protein
MWERPALSSLSQPTAGKDGPRTRWAARVWSSAMTTPPPSARSSAGGMSRTAKTEIPVPAAPARHSARNNRLRRADRVLPAPAPPASIMPERPGQPRCARYTPGQGIREYVFAGQKRTQQPSPEPCAQVRILLGAQLKHINSNTSTILVPIECRACDLRKRGRVLHLAPDPRPGNEPAGAKRAAQRHSAITAARRCDQRPLLCLKVSAATRSSAWQHRDRPGAAVSDSRPGQRPRGAGPRAPTRLACQTCPARQDQLPITERGSRPRRPTREDPPFGATTSSQVLMP